MVFILFWNYVCTVKAPDTKYQSLRNESTSLIKVTVQAEQLTGQTANSSFADSKIYISIDWILVN